MKFRVVTDEEFTSDTNLDNHYNKHIIKEKQFQYSKEEYVERADILSRSKIDNKKIFGYQSLTREGRTANCKYNKETEEFVVYRINNGVPETITMYRKSWRDFIGDKAIEYWDEIVE